MRSILEMQRGRKDGGVRHPRCRSAASPLGPLASCCRGAALPAVTGVVPCVTAFGISMLCVMVCVGGSRIDLSIEQEIRQVLHREVFRAGGPWLREAVVVKQGLPQAAHSFGFEDVEALADRLDYQLRPPGGATMGVCDAAFAKDGLFTTASGPGETLNSTYMRSMLWTNHSIVLNCGAPRVPIARQFQVAFESLAGATVGINFYMTPPSAVAYAPHWDSHEVIAVQLEGRKRWRVWKPPSAWQRMPQLEFMNRVEKSMNEYADSHEPDIDVVLEPGDFIYVPTTWIHVCQTHSDQGSVHLTSFSPMIRASWASLLEPVTLGMTSHVATTGYLQALHNQLERVVRVYNSDGNFYAVPSRHVLGAYLAELMTEDGDFGEQLRRPFQPQLPCVLLTDESHDAVAEEYEEVMLVLRHKVKWGLSRWHRAGVRAAIYRPEVHLNKSLVIGEFFAMDTSEFNTKSLDEAEIEQLRHDLLTVIDFALDRGAFTDLISQHRANFVMQSHRPYQRNTESLFCLKTPELADGKEVFDEEYMSTLIFRPRLFGYILPIRNLDDDVLWILGSDEQTMRDLGALKSSVVWITSLQCQAKHGEHGAAPFAFTLDEVPRETAISRQDVARLLYGLTFNGMLDVECGL